jgi:hypothetical protein
MNEEKLELLWDEINKVEHLNYKINSCQSIIAICAERALGDDSGALWAASDILKDIEEKLDEKIYNLYLICKSLKNQPKKAKKK